MGLTGLTGEMGEMGQMVLSLSLPGLYHIDNQVFPYYQNPDHQTHQAHQTYLTHLTRQTHQTTSDYYLIVTTSLVRLRAPIFSAP